MYFVSGFLELSQAKQLFKTTLPPLHLTAFLESKFSLHGFLCRIRFGLNPYYFQILPDFRFLCFIFNRVNRRRGCFSKFVKSILSLTKKYCT